MRYISESDATERYNDFLDSLHGEVVLDRESGLYWDASRILAEMDPIAYRSGMNDWLDSESLTTDDSEAQCSECSATLTEDDTQDDEMCDDCYNNA
jgi:hypothetical protein